MRVRLLLAPAIAAVVLLVPGVAHAKGPTEATIEGAGLAAPINLSRGDGPSDDVMRLSDGTGLLAAMFAETPDPMRSEPPTTDLGPSLTVTWRVPTSETTTALVHQTLYPYAAGGPIVFTEPGQTTYETQVTYGGWYLAPPSLLALLTNLGVPDRATLEAARRPTAPPSSPAPSSSWSTVAVPAVGALALAGIAIGSAILVGARRRGRVAAA